MVTRRSTERGGPGGAYDLGIDLGTTFTAAAVRTRGAPHAEVVRLDPSGAQVPSVLLVEDDGGLLVGVEAEQGAPAAPERVVREFKRRLGDATPIVVAGASLTADEAAAEMARWTVDRVAALQGAAPRRVVVTHPAGWGAYRRRVFADALAGVGITDALLVAEPEAAALAHTTAGSVAPGRVVAVYDLGGGTFDAAVVEGRAAGLTVLGRGQGLETLGGIDFDEALFWHVCGELGGAVAGIDPADAAAVRAVAALRRSCVAAKETLSSDTEAVVEVDLPTVRTAVRVTRGELEDMIEPALRGTLDVLGQVLDDARVPQEGLDAVLLVGGSARIPLVARLVGAEFGARVVVDADPTTAVARGAALAATRASRGAEQPTTPGGVRVPSPRRRPSPRPRTHSGPRPSPHPRTAATSRTAAVGALAGATVGATVGATATVTRPEPSPTSSPAAVPPHAADLVPAPAPVARRGAPVAAPREQDDDPPTAPLHLADLRPVPARPPVRAPFDDDVDDGTPDGRRRTLVVAAGAGLALAAVLVFAATVPIVRTDTKASTAALPPAASVIAGSPVPPGVQVAVPPGARASAAGAAGSPATAVASSPASGAPGAPGASGATDAAAPATSATSATTVPDAAEPATGSAARAAALAATGAGDNAPVAGPSGGGSTPTGTGTPTGPAAGGTLPAGSGSPTGTVGGAAAPVGGTGADPRSSTPTGTPGSPAPLPAEPTVATPDPAPATPATPAPDTTGTPATTPVAG